MHEVCGTCSVLSYAAGVVIVSFHVHQFGLLTFNLLQSEYVLVGAIWLFMSVIMPLFAALSIFRASIFLPSWRRTEPVLLMWTAAVSRVSAAFFLFAVASLLADTPADALILSLYLALMTAVFSFIGWMLTPWRSSGQETFVVLVPILLFLPVVVIYSSGVYQSITRAFGGGKPTRVWLVPRAGSAIALQQVGLCAPSVPTCGPLDLVFETDHSYFVLKRRRHHVTIGSSAPVSIPKSPEILVEYQRPPSWLHR
jgi:hypothetical protein